jgi:hypothetical protein
MDKLAFVVDGSLGAVPFDKMRLMRGRIREGKPIGSANPIASDRPVMIGRQQLEANVLYESSNTPNVRYYLPLYKVATTGGKPDVQLNYTGGDDGNVGQLSIELTWDAPATPPGMELRAMDHVAELELRFLIPVQGVTNSAGRDSIPLQPLQREANGRARSVTVFSQKAEVDAVYQAMRDEKRQAALNIKIRARVGVKTWQQILIGGTPNKDQQVDALQRRGALFTQVLNHETLATIRNLKPGANSAQVHIKPVQEAELERVFAIRDLIQRRHSKKDPDVKPNSRPVGVIQPVKVKASVETAQPARPAIHVIATPVAVATAPVARVIAPAAMRSVAPSLRKAKIVPSLANIIASTVRPRKDKDKDKQPGKDKESGMEKEPNTVSTRPVLSARTLSAINSPVLAQAIAASDLRINNRAAVPLQIALGANQEPALLDTELESQQDLAFYFNPGVKANEGVFVAVQGLDSRIHLLQPIPVTVNGRTRVVYQDNLMPEVVHVAPEEFRLVRDRESPYLPGLTFLPADMATEEGGNNADEASLIFQMVVNYRLEPWIDPQTIEAARTEVAMQGRVARFTPILPREAQLTLDLDVLGPAKARDKATVEAASGITDTFFLDNEAFTRIWRERLAQPGMGIGGTVSYRLFDGTEAQSRVLITFWETSGDVFDVDFIGPVDGQPGRYSVNVRNRIESPVAIESLPAAVLGQGIVAQPINAGSILNRKLMPQQVVKIDYQVTPPDTPVVSLSPLVIGTVEPNLSALLKVLLLSPGYKSLSFMVPVSAAPGTFEATQGADAEQTIGLLVEFDDGSRAQLTAEAPSVEVSLVGRLVDQILGTSDDQQRYFYRVTNLHPNGEGARTSWREGQGTKPLQVGAAVVQLDF